MKKTFLFLSQYGWFLAAIILTIFALALRLYDIRDATLEFHPVRQLRSAMIARDIYYQISPDIDPNPRERSAQVRASLEIFEPPNFETLVAYTYLLTGGENLAIARAYSALFWIFGGLFLFDLIRRITSSGAALLSLAYYLFLPFAVSVSRSFQPDALMIMGVIISIWAFERWHDSRSWWWTIAVGLLGGVTIYIKATAIYPLGPALAFGVLASLGFRGALRSRQVWTMAGLMVLFPFLYYVFLTGETASQHIDYWAGAFHSLWISPRFYVFWLKMLGNIVGFALLLLGLVGTVLHKQSMWRWLLMGWWLGYFLFGMTFPFQIYTHEYYSLMLVPLLALGLAPIAQLLLDELRRPSIGWRLLALVALLIAVAYPAWLSFTALKGVNYANEQAAWKKMGAELPEGSIVGLTHDYGYRLMYYGLRPLSYWPASIDLNVYAARGADAAALADFDNFFTEKTAGANYFLVTLFGDLDAQPMLKERLYQNYPIIMDGDGYILFDLRHPLETNP